MHGTLKILIFTFLSACSFVRFEVSPYVVRDLEVYYSEQEDLSFFFWKIKHDALLENVGFEIYLNDEYESFQLQEALFAAAPFQCGSDHWCFQFQTKGKYEADLELSPIRSVHVDQGIFAGSKPRLETLKTTFSMNPIGIENNKKIDPHLQNWFSENKVPFKRNFEWQFRKPGKEGCGSSSTSWELFPNDVETGHDWVENTFETCFALRPRRSDDDSPEVLSRLLPSAETLFEKQRYDVPTEKAEAVYGILFDLEIPNQNRCEQVQSWFASQIDSAISANSDSHKLLGLYKPLDTITSKELSGCAQQSQQDFPIAQMLQDARSTISISEQPLRIIWIYINNINQPPSNRVLLQIAGLGSALSDNDELNIYNLGIGSDFILRYYNGNIEIPGIPGIPNIDENGDENIFSKGIGWRPIEDQTFRADIRSWAKSTLPFHTMIHSSKREIPIKTLESAKMPQRFKICQATPYKIHRIGLIPGMLRYRTTLHPSLPWPKSGNPFFTVEIDEQFLMPKNLYRLERVDTVIEVCERFCANGFQTKDRAIFESWQETEGRNPMEVCQWTE